MTHVRPKVEDIERFWSFVNKNGPIMPNMKTKCWVWTGRLHHDGYGAFNTEPPTGETKRAHRWIYQRTHNTILPPHLQILHACDNPPCVRDLHHSVGTMADNNADRHHKGRTSTISRNVGINHGHAKLCDDDIKEIRNMWDSGLYTQRFVSERFKISNQWVSDIVNNKVWKHVL